MYNCLAMTCIMIGTIGYAVRLYGEHRERIRHLRYMEDCMYQMEHEIAYSKVDLLELCHIMCGRTKGIYQLFFQGIKEEIEENRGIEFATVWNHQMDCIKQIPFLREKDLQIFESYPPKLGYLDGEQQKEQVKRKREAFTAYIQLEEEKLKKNQHLYGSLGIMGGLLLVIVFM